MDEVLEDCCEVCLDKLRGICRLLSFKYCPDPQTLEEHDLQIEEDKVYIRGRVE